MDLTNLIIKVAKKGKSLLPQDLQNRITQKVVEARSQSISEFNEIQAFQPSLESFTLNDKITTEAYKYFGQKIQSANWFIPYIPVPYYGGIFTIYRFACSLIDKGIKVNFSVRGCPVESRSEYIEQVYQACPTLNKADFFFQDSIGGVNHIPDADISFATDWPSAYSLLEFNRTKIKYYFIQDYEPLCYGASPVYGLAEATYHFGFIPIVNTQGLYEYYCKLHNPKRAFFFNPAIDTNVFHNRDRVADQSLPIRIFYYCRPNAGRNGFTMGLVALKKIKERWESKVDIVMAGSTVGDPIFNQFPGYFNCLGLMPYEQTGNLYRRCHIGLVTMYTPHTSYLPLELMGCGVCVVTNKAAAKDWLIQHEVNALSARPIVTDIVAQLDRAIQDIPLRQKIAQTSSKYIKQYSWQTAVDSFYHFLQDS